MVSALRLRWAARHLQRGGLVAYPTEAVYGLGCDPTQIAAIQSLLELKGRAAHKGFIVIASRLAWLEELVILPDDAMRQVILSSWPGPVTWVLPARPGLPGLLTGGRPTLAVRLTAHPIAAALSEAAGMALVSTSANPSKRPPARNALQVRHFFFGNKQLFILGGAVGRLSTPTQIRHGATGAMLRPASPTSTIDQEQDNR